MLTQCSAVSSDWPRRTLRRTVDDWSLEHTRTVTDQALIYTSLRVKRPGECVHIAENGAIVRNYTDLTLHGATRVFAAWERIHINHHCSTSRAALKEGLKRTRSISQHPGGLYLYRASVKVSSR